MKQENHTIETSSESLLKSLVGQKFVDYLSDMEMAERAFETVYLRFQNCRIKIKIEEICSPVEWIREGSKTSISAVTSEVMIAPSGKMDAQGTYTPNPLHSYAVGEIVRHVAVVNERTVRKVNGEITEQVDVTRGFLFEFDMGFIAFDKIDPCGEVWTITRGTDKAYTPVYTAQNAEAPDFTTSVSIVRLE